IARQFAVLAYPAGRGKARGGRALLIAEDEYRTLPLPHGFVRMQVAVDASVGFESNGRYGARPVELPDGVVEIAIELAQDVSDGGVGQELSFQPCPVAGSLNGGEARGGRALRVVERKMDAFESPARLVGVGAALNGAVGAQHERWSGDRAVAA